MFLCLGASSQLALFGVGTDFGTHSCFIAGVNLGRSLGFCDRVDIFIGLRERFSMPLCFDAILFGLRFGKLFREGAGVGAHSGFFASVNLGRSLEFGNRVDQCTGKCKRFSTSVCLGASSQLALFGVGADLGTQLCCIAGVDLGWFMGFCHHVYIFIGQCERFGVLCFGAILLGLGFGKPFREGAGVGAHLGFVASVNLGRFLGFGDRIDSYIGQCERFGPFLCFGASSLLAFFGVGADFGSHSCVFASVVLGRLVVSGDCDVTFIGQCLLNLKHLGFLVVCIIEEFEGLFVHIGRFYGCTILASDRFDATPLVYIKEFS